ncbi:nucleoside deaminase [Nocardia sp. NPDC003963]
MREVVDLSANAIGRPGRAPFAAMVTLGGSPVGIGYNDVGESADPTAHGEISAIRAACRTLRRTELVGCELYTSCEPCPLCTAAISMTGISHVYYAVGRTGARALIGSPRSGRPPLMRIDRVLADIASPISARSASASQHLEAEASTVLRSWAETR